MFCDGEQRLDGVRESLHELFAERLVVSRYQQFVVPQRDTWVSLSASCIVRKFEIKEINKW